MDENKFSQLFSPGDKFTEPQAVRFVFALVGSLMSLLFLGVIGFILFEMYRDKVGHPLEFGDRPPPGFAPKTAEAPTHFTAEELAAQFRLVSPPDNTTWSADKPLTVLCRWQPLRRDISEPPLEPTLMIDGFTIPWSETFGRDVWFAHVRLTPGNHRIWVAGENREIEVAADVSAILPQQPDPLPMSHWHPESDDPQKCSLCHDSRDRSDVIPSANRHAELRLQVRSERCFQCHIAVDFEVSHRKLDRPVTRCGDCHALHGTTEPSALLRRDYRP